VSRNAPVKQRRGTFVFLWFSFLITAFAADPLTLSSRTAPRSRVVAVQDNDATESFNPRAEKVQTMVNRGIMTLTEKTNVTAAWLSLVTTQDVVGLKVFSGPGAISGTRPAVVAAVAKGLIAAGVPPQQIVIWDRSEIDLRAAGFFELAQTLGVRAVGSATTGYDSTNFYDTPLIGVPDWDDYEFGKTGEGIGRKSYVTKLVSWELTKIINITPLLNHNRAGVSGNLFGLAMGSVDNTYRFANDAFRLSKAVPEIYAMKSVGDKVVLSITDALICQYEGGKRGLLHYSTVLNQIRFSRDAVALDMLSVKDLDRQRRRARAPYIRPNFDLYANASLLELGVNDVNRVQVDTVK
jgi:uncharacterized protein (DUF362 family)